MEYLQNPSSSLGISMVAGYLRDCSEVDSLSNDDGLLPVMINSPVQLCHAWVTHATKTGLQTALNVTMNPQSSVINIKNANSQTCVLHMSKWQQAHTYVRVWHKLTWFPAQKSGILIFFPGCPSAMLLMVGKVELKLCTVNILLTNELRSL